MAIGAGELLFSIVITGIVLIVLWFFPLLERFMERIQLTRSYKVKCRYDLEKYHVLNELFRKSKLEIDAHHLKKDDDEMVIIWEVSGRAKRHDKIFEQISGDADIEDFSY
jgi:uncharacterized membrane protein YhiD involved in acid resistance